MPDLAQTLITLGSPLLIGFLADGLGRRTRLPRVTLLIAFGFLLGGRLTVSELAYRGRTILWLSLSVVLLTALIVLLGLGLMGVPIAVALVLAGVASATDRAVTVDVVHEVRADGPFTKTLLGIVAIDDAWGLILSRRYGITRGDHIHCAVRTSGPDWNAICA